MKAWLTAQEIADLGLPTVPATERGVRKLAERESWQGYTELSRLRAGREGGGGYEYHFELLPLVARLDYARRYLPPQLSVVSLAPAPATPKAGGKSALIGDARASILRAADRFARDAGLSVLAADRLYSELYNAGTAQQPDWARLLAKSISWRTLARWRGESRHGGVAALASDASQNRKGTGVLDIANDGAVRAFMLALVTHQPHLAAHQVRDICRDEFGDDLLVKGKVAAMPPIRAFQRVLAGLKIEHREVITKITNPDLHRSTMAVAGIGMLRHVTEPNQLWMIDASPVDALCVDGRYSLYAAIDLATRRAIITLSRTPRASAVAMMIRKAVLAWGVPEKIKTDNGSDFVARDTQRLFVNLGIEAETSQAYTPEEKGHIERFIGTFQHEVGPLLNGFIGHNVADRTAIESRRSFAQRLGTSDEAAFKVEHTAETLQARIDDWIALVYSQRGHGGHGLNKASPFALAAASATPIRMVDPRALDLLLMPVADGGGYRTTGKSGIRIANYHYSTPFAMHGTSVFVRHDPLDMGRAYCFSADQNSFLGEAICAELAGVHPATHQQAVREIKGELLAASSRQLRADLKRIAKGPELIERIFAVKRRDMPNVIALPKRQLAHTTPQLDAMQAMQARHEPVAASAEVLRVQAQLQAAAAAPDNVSSLPTRQTPEARFARAAAIERAMAAGEQPEAADLLWLGGYREGPEYRGLARLAGMQERPGA